jgi:hypothetical protein
VLLEILPRVAIEERWVWGEAWGLPLERVIAAIGVRLPEAGARAVRCGAATKPVAARVAAGLADPEQGARIVAEGEDREFLAPLPVDVLEPEERLRTMLEDVGIERCGQLAELPREAVEVRFGPEAVALWRLARAEDERRLFRSVGREQPGASLDFIDYVVTDPERLLFTVNALLGTVCEGLADQGAHARRMILSLPLANGETWRRVLRPARPTGSRSVWLRHTRLLLERLSVPDAVAGVGLQVDGMESAAAVQGDLFDAGFATASAVESALARLLEAQGQVVVRPDPTEHPLAERRSIFEALEAEQVLAPIPSGPAGAPVGGGDPTGLTLQLLPDPRPVLVEAVQERDHILPIRFRDGAWKQLVTAAGPDRVSGGRWEDPYAREYFRCVTQDGVLVWLFRDGRDDAWYLHGWWD